ESEREMNCCWAAKQRRRHHLITRRTIRGERRSWPTGTRTITSHCQLGGGLNFATCILWPGPSRVPARRSADHRSLFANVKANRIFLIDREAERLTQPGRTNHDARDDSPPGRGGRGRASRRSFFREACREQTRGGTNADA